MLVDPLIIVDYALPILCLVLTILAGQALFGTMGYLLGGQSLKKRHALWFLHGPGWASLPLS